MLTLALDTSGLAGSIALLDGENCLEQRALQLGRHHGQSLAPEVKRLLTGHQRALTDIELVAVSSGPGSFTGLRVGVVFAKTLAYAVGCPAIGVETLLVVADQATGTCGELQVIEDAQRGDLFAGRFFVGADGRWRRPDPIRIVPIETWLSSLRPDDVVSGPGVDRLVDRLRARCALADPSRRQPQAAVVGRLARDLLKSGSRSDPWTLEPLYLRRSSAEEKWETRSALPDAAPDS